MQFLKKHYEKIILCVVLLGLAAAAIWMEEISKAKDKVSEPVGMSHPNNKGLVALDLNSDLQALAEMTNPPPLLLSGGNRKICSIRSLGRESPMGN